MIRWSCQRPTDACRSRRAARPGRARAPAAARGARPSSRPPRRSRRTCRCAPRPRTRSARRRGAARASVPARRRLHVLEAVDRARASPGSRSANSSSTATVKSVPSSNAARAVRELLLGRELLFLAHGRGRLPRPGGPTGQTGASSRVGDGRPRPARDRPRASPPARSAVAVGGREREQVARASRAGRRRRRSRTRPGGGGAPGRPPRALPRPRRGREWRATSGGQPAGGRLGRDHAERLREDRRHDRDVGERQQVHEVAVLERPGEERRPRAACRLRSSSAPVVAEADDRPRARRGRASASSSRCTPLFTISFPK